MNDQAAERQAGDHRAYVDGDYLERAAADIGFAEPERILFVGDLHGRFDHFQEVCGLAARSGISVIVQAGDLGYWPHTDPNWVRKADRILARSGCYLIAIDGNHENFAALHLPRPDYGPWKLLGSRMLWAPRGTVWRWQDKTILAAGGGASIDRDWRRAEERKQSKSHQRSRWLWWPEEEISDADVDRCRSAAAAAGSVDILVCHDCPASVRLPLELIDDPATEASRQRLQRIADAARPDLVIHGHYHRRYTGTGGGFGWSGRVEGLADGEAGTAGSCLIVDLTKPLPPPPAG